MSWINKNDNFWENITPEDVQDCINAGEDVNAQDKDGNTPLHKIAGFNQNPKVIDALLNADTDVKVDREVHNKNGDTPLHFATWNKIEENDWDKNPQMITPLLNKGANPNAQNDDGQTPLHVAAQYSKTTELIDYLLNDGADNNIKDKGGKKPFELAEHNEAIEDTYTLYRLGYPHKN